MTNESHRLLGEILKLPSDDRAQIAAALLRSLDEKVDADAEAKWAEVKLPSCCVPIEEFHGPVLGFGYSSVDDLSPFG
ncbi:MAG: addiction module protein, partial [Myxococcota bacterium]